MKNLMITLLLTTSFIFTGCFDDTKTPTPPQEEAGLLPNQFDLWFEYKQEPEPVNIIITHATDTEINDADNSAVFINVNCYQCEESDIYFLFQGTDPLTRPADIKGLVGNQVSADIRLPPGEYNIAVIDQEGFVIYESEYFLITDEEYQTFLYTDENKLTYYSLPTAGIPTDYPNQL